MSSFSYYQYTTFLMKVQDQRSNLWTQEWLYVEIVQHTILGDQEIGQSYWSYTPISDFIAAIHMGIKAELTKLPIFRIVTGHSFVF